jgi:Fic family protein
MLIPPKYFLTPAISKYLSKIEASKEVVENISIPPEIELNIRRRSTLKSSLFSARIEGNPIILDEYPTLPPKDRKRVEIQNILKAINWIQERGKRSITEKDILTLHSIVMKGIEYEELGKFRKKHEGIFTTAGTVVYHAPPPSLVPKLIKKMLSYANGSKEQFVPIKAITAHYIFEKIHPFSDGSGRVGRLLIQLILTREGYGFKGILPFEEKIDKRRETYYKMLEEPERDITNYLEFMLEILSEAAEESKNLILDRREIESFESLLPRRAEILAIIKDHKIVNFDMIKRRFKNVNERTLRYDILRLTKEGFIQKLGTTRGVYYKAKNRI